LQPGLVKGTETQSSLEFNQQPNVNLS